jgi:hypothetical protein
VIYDILGAILGSCLIYNILCFILSKFMEKKLVPFLSFIGSFILILVVTTFTMGFVNGFILYMPPLFIWLLVELKISKKNIKLLDKAKEAPLD